LPEPKIAEQVEGIGGPGIPYEEAKIALPEGTEAHLLPLEAMVDALHRVVEVEGPVHEDEIVRRIARACGRVRTGGRLAEAVGRGLAEALRSGLVARESSFWRPTTRDEPRVRDRSKARSAALRRPHMVPASEIRAAAMRVLIHAEFDARPADIVTRVARLLGLSAEGARLRAAIQAEIDRLAGERPVAGSSKRAIEERRASAA
jgi:Protein of unknown function (DUF3320)